MFRRPPQLKPESLLKSSDKRRLKADILKQHSLVTESDNHNLKTTPAVDDGQIPATPEQPQQETVDLIPNKADVYQAKFVDCTGQVFGSIYSLGRNPAWIMLDDLGFVPTLYTLFQFPSLLPVVFTHGPVIPRLQSGSDLMAPGLVLDSLPHVPEGTLVSIAATGNQCPLGVGVTLMNLDALLNGLSQGTTELKGKAVKILHMVDDALYALGTKTPVPMIPMPDKPIIAEIDDDYEMIKSSDELSARSWELVPNVEDNGPEPLISSLEDISLDVPDTTQPEEQNTMSPAEMDHLLLVTLVSVLQEFPPDKDKDNFPINTSTLVSKHIHPRAPEIDIKKSTHKKYSKFFKAMDKRGLIKCKEMKGEVMLLGINRNHDDFKNTSASNGRPSQNQTRSTTDEAQQQQQKKKNDGSTVSVLYLFKPVSKLYEFLQSANLTLPDNNMLTRDTLFTQSDFRIVLNSYIARENLADPTNKRFVRLTAPLFDAIKTKRDSTDLMDKMARDELVQRVCDKCVPYHLLHVPNHPDEIIKGDFHPVSIIVDRRGGNKLVTKISGFEFLRIQPDELASTLKKKCAGGVSVAESEIGKGLEVIVQGEKVKETLEVLEASGIPVNKTGKIWKSDFVNVSGKGWKGK